MSKFEIQDLSNRAYKAIKDLILQNELKPGDRLHQEDLANRFGISRTPILQAISKLEKEMLVETITHKGSFIRKFDTTELLQIYDVRLRLEPLSAYQAAQNATSNDVLELEELLEAFIHTSDAHDLTHLSSADYTFHNKIIEMSKNKILQEISSVFSLIMVSNNRGLLKNPHDSIIDHKAIFSAIKDHNTELAEKSMFSHIRSARENLLSSVVKL